MRSRLDDAELVELSLSAPEGDTRAFDELVRRYEAAVRANCRHLTRVEDDTWDLAQEVLVKAFHSLRRFERRAAFRTWLWRIKSNHCLTYLDRRRVRERVRYMSDENPVLSEQPSRARPSDQMAEASITADLVRHTLDQLSDQLRVPLVLRDLDGMSYDEIADQLGVGVSAAKMRVSRARAAFRALYQETPGMADIR